MTDGATSDPAVAAVAEAVQLSCRFTTVRDEQTGVHLERIGDFARVIVDGLVDDDVIDLRTAELIHLLAPLHDIGKVGIPDAILLKPGPLGEAEWEVMKGHTVVGRQMVDQIVATIGLDDDGLVATMTNIVELHHETMDGRGYPHGLSEDDVPIEARVVAVADVFDALTTERTYKPAWTIPETMAELERLVETNRLDGRCVAVMQRSVDRLAEMGRTAPGPVAGDAD